MPATAGSPAFLLRFRPLAGGRGYAFPCDSSGHVDLDGLSERGRDSYLFARAVVGRDVAWPEIERGRLQ